MEFNYQGLINRMTEIVRLHGDSQRSAALACGMNECAFAAWRKGSKPSIDAVLKFSKHYRVSLSYLLYGVEESRYSPDDLESDLIATYRQLPANSKNMLRSYADSLLIKESK